MKPVHCRRTLPTFFPKLSRRRAKSYHTPQPYWALIAVLTVNIKYNDSTTI